MNDLLQPTSRRTLLQRGLMVMAGALGVQLPERDARGDPAPPPPPTVEPAGGKTLRFYAQRLRVHTHGQQPGELPAPSGRNDSHCELLDGPNGKSIGQFSATCFHPEMTAHPDRAAGNVELQTFRIQGDNLFGIGPGHAGTATGTAQVILGGTGRYAGVRGTYVIRENRDRSGRAQIEFVINLLT